MPIVTLILAVCFALASVQINQIMQKFCYRTLNETANQIATNIQEEVSNDQSKLTLFAELLAADGELNADTVSVDLKKYQLQSDCDTMAVLLPDSVLYFADGTSFQPTLTLDFETEKTQVPYCSGICKEQGTSAQKYLYQAVPVIQNSQVTGILYGFQTAENFANAFTTTAFEGWCNLYIIDGSTDEFILDSMHSTPEDTADYDWSMYKAGKGYDYATLQKDMNEGKSGYFSFTSTATDETYYMRYCPVGVNQWMVQVTVPETIIFSSSRQVQKVIGLIVCLYIATFFLFFAWIFIRNHRDSVLQERRLTQMTYMYEVQRALYDAPQKPELVDNALRIAGNMLTSDRVFLIVLSEAAEAEDFYIWRQDESQLIPPPDVKMLQRNFVQQWKQLAAGETVMLYAKGMAQLGRQDHQILEMFQIENLLLVPVRDTKQRLCGVLGSINMQSEWPDGMLLECVAGSFLMALQGICSYRLIRKMGTTDAVTGLKNRNSYQLAVSAYSSQKSQSLCCIYADANGLHELNNHLGHAAGDAMLRYIGDNLKEIFGENDAYRIGGDEFVVFCHGCTEDEITGKLEQFHQKMQEQEYHVSVGTAWLHTADIQMDHLIADAECRMYEAKRLYYQTKGDLSKAREMNRKLEKILLEKKDADNFLQIIASYFLGVYVVDLTTDHTRAIYKPKYFQEKLEKSGGRFLPAMEMYLVNHVDEADKEALRKFLDYNTLRERIAKGQQPEYMYRKPNGTKVRVRVYPAEQYSEKEQETFWLFEAYHSNLE